MRILFGRNLGGDVILFERNKSMRLDEFDLAFVKEFWDVMKWRLMRCLMNLS